MNKLKNLICKFCPDGVNCKKLVEVADVLYGYPCDATAFNDAGKGLPLARIRDVLAGRTNTYTTEIIPENYIISNGDLLVGMDGNFHVATWKMSRSILCQRVCRISSKDDAVVYNGFLNHILPPIIKEIEQNKQSGTVKHLLAKDINAICIPLPPLAVQQEIVRILDSFTELTAKLTAELTARRKQYEHYRDELLSSNAPRWEKKVIQRRLSEVADISTGSSNTDDAIENGLYPFYVRSQEPLAKNEYEFDEEAIITAGDGVGVGKVFHYVKGKFALHQRAYRIHPTADTLNGRFLYHYFIAKFPAYIGKQMYQGSVPSIRRPMLNNFEVLIPPIEVQQQIVDILDRFDLICSDLTSGLPAEIAARQKQYEYYRDKLLTFKELDT